jgi:hypothetical protein
LKCYNFQGEEPNVRTYFLTVRRYETPAFTNDKVAEQIQQNICASAGYYSSSNLDSCKCAGCCIPVAYKARVSGLLPTRVPAAAGLSAESQALLGTLDNCVHMKSSFRIKRAPLIGGPAETPTCDSIETREGYVDLPNNYGGALAALKLRNHRQAQKGLAMSGIRRGRPL